MFTIHYRPNARASAPRIILRRHACRLGRTSEARLSRFRERVRDPHRALTDTRATDTVLVPRIPTALTHPRPQWAPLAGYVRLGASVCAPVGVGSLGGEGRFRQGSAPLHDEGTGIPRGARTP